MKYALVFLVAMMAVLNMEVAESKPFLFPFNYRFNFTVPRVFPIYRFPVFHYTPGTIRIHKVVAPVSYPVVYNIPAEPAPTYVYKPVYKKVLTHYEAEKVHATPEVHVSSQHDSDEDHSGTADHIAHTDKTDYSQNTVVASVEKTGYVY